MLVEIVRHIQTQPQYLLAKGCITSSDLATKAMGAHHAEGVVKNWDPPTRPSTRYLLLDAEKGSYVVRVFDVYNLEGVAVVIAVAEAEKNSVILQIHPCALKHGEAPLVTCCLSAAEHTAVPLTVHLDHGSAKQAVVKSLELGFDSWRMNLGDYQVQKIILTVEEYEAKLMDLTQAEEFLRQTGVDVLAVCIGNVPVLEVVSTNPMSCALHLFPTKALTQDQLQDLLEMTRSLKFTLTMGIYEGLFKFQHILSNFRFMIMDEAHAYLGAFRYHTSVIIWRMCQVCYHLYGVDPVSIISSATAANPCGPSTLAFSSYKVPLDFKEGSNTKGKSEFW
eukprot:Gb_37701 [translate_table: standard]